MTAKNCFLKRLQGSTLLPSSEPFRVFFPLGMLAGIWGVLLWPLYYWGAWSVHPSVQHPRLLIFGFGSAFLTGFLGTSWPRFLETKKLTNAELLLLIVMWAATQYVYLFGEIALGDIFFGVFGGVFGIVLLSRLLISKSTLPAGFSFAFLSVVLSCGIGFLWGFDLDNNWGVEWQRFIKLLAYQGYLLFPLLGIGSYLFFRFFKVSDSDDPFKPIAKKRRVYTVATSFAIILISFVLEAFGFIRIGNLLRFCAILLWMFGATPYFFNKRAPNTRAWALRMAVFSIAISFLLRVFMPMLNYVFAVEHVMFIGGIGLIIFLIADRVIIGHCTDASPRPRSIIWRIIFWLLLLCNATRFSADVILRMQQSHYIYAAILWAIICALWGAFLIYTIKCSKSAINQS